MTRSGAYLLGFRRTSCHRGPSSRRGSRVQGPSCRGSHRVSTPRSLPQQESRGGANRRVTSDALAAFALHSLVVLVEYRSLAGHAATGLDEVHRALAEVAQEPMG